MSNICDFIQVFVFTTNQHLKPKNSFNLVRTGVSNQSLNTCYNMKYGLNPRQIRCIGVGRGGARGGQAPPII